LFLKVLEYQKYILIA